jgi:hypothetical protein
VGSHWNRTGDPICKAAIRRACWFFGSAADVQLLPDGGYMSVYRRPELQKAAIVDDPDAMLDELPVG